MAPVPEEGRGLPSQHCRDPSSGLGQAPPSPLPRSGLSPSLCWEWGLGNMSDRVLTR